MPKPLTLAERQLACRDKMIAQGKHVFNPLKKVRSKDHHIGEWIKPTIKAINRKAKKAQKKPAVIIPLIKKALP